jgi:hypothetical protein
VIGARGMVRRLVLAFALALTAAVTASCGGALPIGHHVLSDLPLSADDGWIPLPTGRWLLAGDIEPEALLICPAAMCADPGLVARINLKGAERAMAERLSRDPVGTLTGAVRKPARTTSAQASRTVVTSLAIGDWRGGMVRIESLRDRGRAAHVVVLARTVASDSRLLVTVAPEAEMAEARARLAVE